MPYIDYISVFIYSNVHENSVYMNGKKSHTIVPLWYTDVFSEAVRFFEAIILTLIIQSVR